MVMVIDVGVYQLFVNHCRRDVWSCYESCWWDVSCVEGCECGLVV